MRARCPKCQQIVDYTAEESAQPIRCPHCQQAFRVKPATTASPTTAKTVAKPAPAKSGSAKTATAARPVPPVPAPLPIPVPQPNPTPDPVAPSFDVGVKTGSPSTSGSFVTTSRPAAKHKPKRRMSTAVLLSLILGVPVVLIAMCAGIGYYGIQAAAQQAKEQLELSRSAHEFAHAEAVKRLKPDGEPWVGVYMVLPNENGRFSVHGAINEMVNSKLAAQHKYDAEVSYNATTKKWTCHKLTFEAAKKK